MARKATAAQAAPQAHPLRLPAGMSVKRRVIQTVLNLQVGQPRTLKILDALRESSYRNPDPKKQKDKPATICGVVDVQTGETATLICPAVLAGNLRESYPKDAYVGKTFYMEKLAKRPGKRYFDFTLVEVEGKAK